jgi:gamma-glutamylcyclotransferase (GGCT)/AIG2-like uncharacterized protein YtfP
MHRMRPAPPRRTHETDRRHLLFVHGILRRGEHHERLLARDEFLGEVATAEGYRLFDLGSAPGMVVSAEGTARGELYEVSAATLASLDRLHGHPRWIRRQPVVLERASGHRFEAWAYLHTSADVAGKSAIESGDWIAHREARA